MIHFLHRHRSERGVTAIEFVIVTPVLIAALLLMVGAARMAHARQQVESLAGDAARAASLERNTSASVARGQDVARRSAGELGLSCLVLNVDVDISSYEPGGVVTAHITCHTRLSDLGLVGFPGSKTFTANASVPIENYRAS